MSYYELFLIIFIIVEAVIIIHLNRKVNLERKRVSVAQMHVFYDGDKIMNMDLIASIPIEDLLKEKIFVTEIVEHKT